MVFCLVSQLSKFWKVSSCWMSKRWNIHPPGNTKGGSITVQLTSNLVCFANKNENCQLSYNWFQTSQTGGQQYSDTSPFSIPCTHKSLLVLFSPIFYEQFFRMKVFCTAFMCLQFGFVIFWQKEFGAKAANKMLLKLTPVANVIKLFMAVSYDFS